MEAKKDVASCEKLRGAASELRSADVRMGEPGWLKTSHPVVRQEANPGN